VAGEAVLNADAVIRALQGAYARGDRGAALLRVAAARIRAAGPPYTGVYLYMLHGDELVLEAFDGRATEHTHIPVGSGICGQAVAQRADLNVADVTAAPGYLACSLETRSELVVLIRRHADILGQIDIDSDVPAGFDPVEQAAVKEVADGLATLL
jgi:L-methionine (R)-S-oxide reductase